MGKGQQEGRASECRKRWLGMVTVKYIRIIQITAGKQVGGWPTPSPEDKQLKLS
jgi:hypothetical protein